MNAYKESERKYNKLIRERKVLEKDLYDKTKIYIKEKKDSNEYK